jgi:Ca-activated chloride channel homolog
MNSDFHFLRPLWFALLVPLLVLVWWALRQRAHGSLWSRVCDAALLPYVVQGQVTHLKNSTAYWLLAAGALVITALAGPVWQRLPVPVFRADAALVIALDLSSSMTAADIKPSRLARAKYKVADLLRGRTTGQTALLVFAAQSFVVTPLTNDSHTISAQLQALETSIMPSQGSEPATALELAGKLLEQAGMPEGDVLLITDGADEAAMSRAREAAQGAGFRLSVLGVGSHDGAPIPDAEGGFTKAASGGLVMARLDGSSLQALSQSGRGLYLESRADDSDTTALNKYFDSEHAAHAQRLEQLASSQWYEFGPWLLLPLLPFAALAFRRGVLAWCAVVVLGSLTPRPAAAQWWHTPDQLGQQAFQAEDYEGAARAFDNPAWRAAARYRKGDFVGAVADLKDDDSAQGHYNRGNALARQGQLTAAVAAYDEALKRAPDNDDAKFNRDLVAKQLREQQRKDQPQQPGQSRPPDETASSQRNDQQFGAGQGGEPQQDTPASSNAGGGEKAKEEQQGDDATKNAKSQDEARAKLAPPATDAEPNADQSAQERSAQDARANPLEAEKNQATEQWLQQIPDDPAGLLRRKFEYQYKQLYGDKPSTGNPW